MEYTRNNDTLTVLCEGALTSANAAAFQQEVTALITREQPGRIVFDLKNVDYISSSGLRVFITVSRQGTAVELTNAAAQVYEVLDITGFTSLFPVSRKMRSISVENAELIGSGFFSRVYRVSADSIVKVFIQDTSLADINRERELARNAFLLGIPAAITFDIVDVDGRYGLLFESINGGTFTQKIRSDPEHLEAHIRRYARLLKDINNTRGTAGDIPLAADINARKLETIRPFITGEEYQKLAQLLSGIEDTHTYVHADCHPGNIMLQNDELMIIDLDTLCIGNPIFELAPLYSTCFIFEECFPGNNRDFLKLEKDVTSQLYLGAIRYYFEGLDAQAVEENLKKIRLCAYFHTMAWNKVNKREDTGMFALCYRRLRECLQETDSLQLEWPVQ